MILLLWVDIFSEGRRRFDETSGNTRKLLSFSSTSVWVHRKCVFSLSLSLTHSVIDQSKYLQLNTLKIRQEITIKPDIAKDFPPLEEAAGG